MIYYCIEKNLNLKRFYSGRIEKKITRQTKRNERNKNRIKLHRTEKRTMFTFNSIYMDEWMDGWVELERTSQFIFILFVPIKCKDSGEQKKIKENLILCKSTKRQ